MYLRTLSMKKNYRFWIDWIKLTCIVFIHCINTFTNLSIKTTLKTLSIVVCMIVCFSIFFICFAFCVLSIWTFFKIFVIIYNQFAKFKCITIMHYRVCFLSFYFSIFFCLNFQIDFFLFRRFQSFNSLFDLFNFFKHCCEIIRSCLI